MAKYSFLSLGTLCLLVLFHGCLARQQQEHTQPQHQFRGEKSKCQLYNLDALEPFRRVEAEAGLIEYWDQNDDQFQCAGVAAFRITIEPNGLALPAYHNAPQLIYVVQGKGVLGLLLPSCPETFHSFQRHQQSEDQDSRSQTSTKQDRKSKRSEDQYSKSQRLDDQHQKLRFFKQGDIIAVPNGAAYWFYNDGDTPVVAFSFSDTTNNVNQLDDRMRKFYLAGHVQEEQQQQQQQQQQRGSSSSRRQQKAEQESSGNNIFSGFDVKLLAQAYGVRKETARKLQGENDQRGPIIHVKEGLQVIKSILSEDEEQQQEKNVKENGFEETLCNMRLRQNIDKATSADIYTPLGGRVTNLNSQSLPILGFLQLSAERGYLYKNSMLSPHWNMNAHSVIYVLSGEARVQIVGDSGHTVFDGQLRKNQLLILPQNYAIVKQAGDDGFEWISFKTNDNAMISSLAGRASVIRSMPEEILVNSYQISNEEARRLKFKREEMLVFKPKSESHGRSAAM